MTSTCTLRFEGPPACADCTREGVVCCDHIGFNPEAWDGLVGRQVHAPGLDPSGDYVHVLRGYEITERRKVVVLTVDTDRPLLRDLARHLSVYGDPRAKAAVRAVHHDTGTELESGWYDAPLQPGQAVCIDRDVYHVVAVEHPNRDPVTGVAAEVDLQVARLRPVPPDAVREA